MKTKRSIPRRVAIASPLCLALLAIVQGGYFSLNLFNWFYVVLLPATFSLISVTAVNIDNGKLRLQATRCLPIEQKRIWLAKLLNTFVYALFSCMLLSVAVIVVPSLLSLMGISQIKPLSMVTVLLACLVIFLTSAWQLPLSFILSKKIGSIFTIGINLFVSFSGVLLALKSYWFLCPWAWVNRCMIPIIGVLPNGLPNENTIQVELLDVIISLALALGLSAILGYIATRLFANTEAR